MKSHDPIEKVSSYEEGEIFIEIVDIYVIYRLYHKIGAYERFIL